jgi:hypothetical protein
MDQAGKSIRPASHCVRAGNLTPPGLKLELRHGGLLKVKVASARWTLLSEIVLPLAITHWYIQDQRRMCWKPAAGVEIPLKGPRNGRIRPIDTLVQYVCHGVWRILRQAR